MNPSSSTTRTPTGSCSASPTRSSATIAPSARATTTRSFASSPPAARGGPCSSSVVPAATRLCLSHWLVSQRNGPTLRKPSLTLVDLRPRRADTPCSPQGPSRRTRSRSRAMPRRSCRSTSATWKTPRRTTRGLRPRAATRRCSRSHPPCSLATCIPSTLRRSGRASAAARAVCRLRRCSITMRTSPPFWASTDWKGRCAASRSTERATERTAPSGAGKCCWRTARRSSGSRTSSTCPCPAARPRCAIRCAWPTARCGRSTCSTIPVQRARSRRLANRLPCASR